MYPKEYQEFSLIVKKYVVLNILIKTIKFDRNIINKSKCKLITVYNDSLVEVQWLIENNLLQLKKEMKTLGGSIIEEKQATDVRIVKVKFKNYIYVHRYLNYVLQSECEQLLKKYLVVR